MRILDNIFKQIECEKGISLISTALIMILVGNFTVAGSKFYEIRRYSEAMYSTDEKITTVQKALTRYVAENGRYPCPAPLNAAIDTPEFGIEVTADCTAGDFAGTFRSLGRLNRGVRTGTIPVRTLNIADSYMMDGYGTRLVYAITEAYAAPDAPINEDMGAIEIIDGNGNNATARQGNIVQVVYSMGGDANGSFSVDGNIIENCTDGLRASENCDYADDAIFMNTVNKSTNENNLFVHRISYVPDKTVITCEDASAGAIPKDIAYLIDTSGSMNSNGGCPSSMGSSCSRMDVARWAMRRVLPARIYNNNQIDDAGSTSMTGFVGRNTVTNVNNNLGDIVFDDPNVDGYESPTFEDLAQNIETELQAMCPNGSTPLGIHLTALADRIGDGTESRPNKIMVLSDGRNTNGMDPVAAAQNIHNLYPNIKIDIIDVVGNDSLIQIAQITGGSYYFSANPDELLDALYSAAGTCASDAPPDPPVDQPGCGSSGNWWQNN